MIVETAKHERKKMIYLMGTGPGDPELLTLKAARLLRFADEIYLPQSQGTDNELSERVIKPHVVDWSRVHLVPVSMRADRIETYRQLAAEMASRSEGRNLVYVSQGDSTLFSTCQYLTEELDARGAAYEYVPGISAISAAAARTKTPLAVGDDALAIHIMPNRLDQLESLSPQASTLALMRIDKKVRVLTDYVAKHAPERAMLAYRLGLRTEQIYNLTDGSERPDDFTYLSTAIIRRKKPE